MGWTGGFTASPEGFVDDTVAPLRDLGTICSSKFLAELSTTSGTTRTTRKDAQVLADRLARVESVKSYTRMRLQVMPGDREAGEPTAHECSTCSRFQ
jgi:hypothetical protein